MASRTLLSLNQDVLSEILAHLLLDTPRALNRASILRTCSSLRLLGLPHLYRIVDLTGYKTRDEVLQHWETLFGEGGVLTVGGTNGEVGSFVRGLRLGAEGCPGDSSDVCQNEHFLVPTLLLPNCSTLLLDLKHLDHFTFHPLPHIISQLPVQNLTLRDHTSHPSQGSHPSPLEPSTDDGLLFTDVGLPSAQIWDDLVVVTMEGSVWADEVSWEDMSTDEGIERANLALSTWSFKVLVVRFDASYDRWDEGRIVCLFLDPDPMDLEGFLRSTERVEIRGGAPVEKEFRRVIGERREVGLSESEERIASLIVFVEEDGSERRLLEKVETL